MPYDLEHIRKYKLDIVDKEFKEIPGAWRTDLSILPKDEYFWSRDRIASGAFDLVELLWVNWVSNGAYIAFSPVLTDRRNWCNGALQDGETSP
jgi:hypothetical protein